MLDRPPISVSPKTVTGWYDDFPEEFNIDDNLGACVPIC